MRLFNFSLLALVFVLSTTISARATVFFVSTDGSDSNAGTSAAPFATIQKAADAATAGDTVKVAAGTYAAQNPAPYRAMTFFRRSGTPAQPITFEAVSTVVVKGDGGVYNFGGIFEISGSDASPVHDIVIRGFRFENSDWFGIKISKAQNITVENNYTYNTGGSGILAIQAQNVAVRGNTLERACISPDTTRDTQEIISLSGVDGFEIANNHVFNGGITNGGNGGEGIDAKTGSKNGAIHHNTVHDLVRLGIYVDAWDQTTENINAYANRVYNCSAGIAVSSENGGTARNVKIYNNLLYNNKFYGVIVSAWAANGARENIEIVNNTIVGNGVHVEGQYDYGGGISVETANARTILIRNNLLSRNTQWQISVNDRVGKITIDHNLFDSLRAYVGSGERERKGKLYFTGDPLFVDAGNGNFHLRANSSAIDRGKSIRVPNVDFDSIPRPQANGYDLGAFEMN